MTARPGDPPIPGMLRNVDTRRMREEEVFQAIAHRVAALDYSDEVFVRPGYLDADGSWVLTPSADDVRWLEERGSQAHLAAEAVGAVDPLPPLEPASAEAVAEAERLLGHPLPPWACPALTDIRDQGTWGLREDVHHHGEHGEEAAAASAFVHAGVQGRDR